jgi:NAD(P)-dependent dehydrogenase (short-subunit alcohol dehydrogenase family)
MEIEPNTAVGPITDGQSNRSLEGKVIVVSGASRRLGRCYALSLAKAGANVVALARTLGDDSEQIGTLAEVRAAARKAGRDVATFQCDLSRESEIEVVVDEVVREFGGIDGLVNNAIASVNQMDCLHLPQDVWEESLRVNVRGPYVLMARSIPHMIARGGGSIINVTSVSAGTTSKGSGAHAGLLQYGLSKAALNRLTTYFAAEFEEDNIAVNAISPGDASAYMRVMNHLGPDVPEHEVLAGHQLDEEFWGNPIVYLAGVRSSEMTGQVLHTYTFGQSWGPSYMTPPEWSPEIRGLLSYDNAARPRRK